MTSRHDNLLKDKALGFASDRKASLANYVLDTLIDII